MQRSSNVIELTSLIDDIEAMRTEAGIPQDTTWAIPKSLTYRIVAISNLFQPNIPANGSVQRLLSAERGLLVKALVEYKVDFPLIPNPDFTGADLENANLTHADLQGANLAESDFTSAVLIGANLSWATLSHATCSAADFGNARMTGCSLAGADLSWSNLFGTDLTDANLQNTDLTGAKLIGTRLESAVGLNVEQLCRVSVLGDIQLDRALLDELGGKYPGLLDEPK